MSVVRVKVLLLVTALAARWPSLASAQSSVHATLSGRIDDPSGGPVPGAAVVLTNEDTGVVQTTITESTGGYQFVRVVPGRYLVEVRVDGFGRARRGLTLAVNDAAVVNLALPLAAVDTTVTVQGASRPISRSAAVSAVIDSDQIQELPLNSRDFQRLMVLAPGAPNATLSSALFGSITSTAAGFGPRQLQLGGKLTF